ncbi:MAG: hypothetical protein IT308_02920 [Anaerolineaceae bacterium]|nr:hypothetical protein [Anaerolineaceae bacterium]
MPIEIKKRNNPTAPKNTWIATRRLKPHGCGIKSINQFGKYHKPASGFAANGAPDKIEGDQRGNS